MSNPTTPAPMLPPESEQPSEAQAAARGMGQIASIGKETVEASAWLLNIPAPPERAVKPRAEISLGDLAQAVTVLQPADPMLHTEIAALLGLRPREAALQILIEQEPTREETVTGEQTVIRDRADPEVIPASRRKSRRPRPALSARPVRFTVQLEEEREPESIPSWLATYDHKQRDAAPNLPPVPLPELIPANYIRALLARLLAAPIPEGLVDVEELVETIAHGRPVSYIPRQPIPSLRLGVQLLIDTSESMAPFSEDQDYLLEHIQDLVGSDNLELLWFEKNPLQGVYGENDDDPRAYEPPPHGSKVLLLSDLGLGDRTPQASSSGLWRRFARIIHEADAYLLALVPYGSWRWPSTLSGILPMLYWERFWNPRRPWRRTALPASKALRTLARRNPQALELAKFLSLAARIDRPLLRAARLQLLPKMDAGAEADIWLSPLAQSRSFASMLLSPKVARELRRLLAEDGKEAVEEAWQFLSAFRERGGINYDVRQEEYMNYLALHPDFDEVTEATKLLQEALAALVKGGEQRLDVARWALRAVPRLPDTVRNLPVAGELYYASAVRLGITPADESVLPEDMDRLEWLQPADASTISVGAQLIQGGLKFSREVAPDMAELRVKDTTPVLLDVSWPAVVTAEKQQVTIGPTGPVTLGAASCQLISVSDDGTIGHWQVQNGEEIAVFGEPEQYLQCQAVSPDGRLLAGGDREGTFALWDLLTGRQLFRQERESPDIGTDNIDISQQFTKNANIGSSDIGPDEIQDQGIIALAFSSDGRYLAAARAGRSVEIWRIYGTRPRLNLTLSNPATALAFDPRNHNLVTGDQDGRVIYWDLSSHEIETEPVAGIDLMVEAADAERLGFSVERRGAIHAVAFVADEQQIVTGDQNGLILLWRVDPPTLWSGFNGLKGAVSGFAFDSGSGQVAVGSQDTLAILRIENNQILQRERREFPALSAAFSPDGHFLFTGLRSGEIRVLESEGLEEISKISGHHLTVSGLSAFNSPAATYTINTSEGRQYTIGPDRRALSFSPLLTFDHLIDGSRRALHSEVFVALDEIDAWLASAANDPQQPHRAFVASSGPGGGKSTLSGTLVEISRGQADDAATYQNLRENLLAAVHICSSDQEKSLDARTFVMSLAQQIAGYMPEFGERLHAAGQLSGAAAAWAANPANGDQLEFNITPLAAEDQPAAALLQTYLVEPLAQLAAEEQFDQLLILVSGLHQADGQTPTSGEPLLPLIPLLDTLPPNVRFIFVNRAHSAVMAQLAALQPQHFALTPEPDEEVPFDDERFINEIYTGLVETFNVEELKTLCFLLAVDYDNLAGRAKSEKIAALIAHMERSGRFADLEAEAKRQRPQTAWPQYISYDEEDSSPEAVELRNRMTYRSGIYEFLAQYFNVEELMTLCFDLSIDYEDLPAQAKNNKIRELILYLERRGQLAELEERLKELRPQVPWPDLPARPDLDVGRPSASDLTFVNRENELQLFEEMLTQRRELRIMLIKGEAGMGKSALLSAMNARLEENQDAISAEIRLQPDLAAAPETILLELQQAWGGMNNFPRFLEAVASPADGEKELPSRRWDRNLGSAFFEDLSSLARNRTAVVIFLDNYEYATERTREWVGQEMLTWTKGIDNLLFVIAGRDVPESVPIWSSATVVINLSALSREDVRSYMSRMQVDLDPELVETLYETSGGNPARLGEMVSNLMNRDA